MAGDRVLPDFEFNTDELKNPKPRSVEPTTTQPNSVPAKSLPDFYPDYKKQEAPNLATDAILGGASGLAEGAVGAPGIFRAGRDIADLAFQKLAAYPESWITGKPREEIEKDIAKGQEKYRQNQIIPGPPSAHTLIEGAKSIGMPSYDPQTDLGKETKNIGEFVGGSWVPLGGSLGNRLMSGLGAGLTSSAAGQMFKGTENENTARFLGSLPGAIAGGGLNSMYAARSAPAVGERASRIAGDVLREAETDPNAVLQRMQTAQQQRAANPNYFVEGVNPTTTELGGASQGLENRILAGASRDSSAIVGDLRGQQAASREALGAAASELPGKLEPNLPQGTLPPNFGLSGQNPQGAASSTLKDMLIASEQASDEAVKGLWNDPALKNAAIYKNKSVQQLFDHIDNMSPSKQAMIDPKVLSVLDNLAANQGVAVPLSFIQDLRSQVLGQARELAKKGDRFGAFVHGDIGEQIAKIINDPANIRFGDVSGAARGAWDKARTATSEYYKDFGPAFVRDALAETAGGSAKIAPEALLDRMFKSPNAIQNFQELRGVLGPEAERHAGDWIIGKLTKNGTDINLTEDAVRKFLADPKVAGLADEIPGLRARLEDLGQKAGETAEAARIRQLNTTFQQVADGNNPKTLSNFLARHGDDLKSVLPQEQAEYIDALKRSADVIKNSGNNGIAGTKTFDRLANNDIFTILYGRAAGAITDSAMFGIAASALSKIMGLSVPGIEIMGAAVGQTGQLKAVSNYLRSFANNTVFGSTQQEARELLQRAMLDPELRIALMQKPTAQNVETLGQLLKGGLKTTPEYVAQKSIPGVMDYERREGRATGGRVGGIAERLMNDAARAHKYHQKTTEEILDAPDEHVVKALAVASKHI